MRPTVKRTRRLDYGNTIGFDTLKRARAKPKTKKPIKKLGPPVRVDAGSEDNIFGENPRAAPGRKQKKKDVRR